MLDHEAGDKVDNYFFNVEGWPTLYHNAGVKDSHLGRTRWGRVMVGHPGVKVCEVTILPVMIPSHDPAPEGLPTSQKFEALSSLSRWPTADSLAQLL